MSTEIINMFDQMTELMSNLKESNIMNNADYKIRRKFREVLVDDYHYDNDVAMKLSWCLTIDVKQSSVNEAILDSMLNTVESMVKVFVTMANILQEEIVKPLDFFVLQKIAERFEIKLD